MVKHQRRSKLVVEDEVLLLQKVKIQSGDCFVAFSVRKLKETKKRILFQQPDMKCTLLYGSLPPEVKFEAAEKFMKDCENKKGVLIATDAIGMGLNLPIRRVIFTQVTFTQIGKFLYRYCIYVKIPLVKQIAGRAGRGSENGYCTATEPIKQAVLDLDPKTLPILEHRWGKLGEYNPRILSIIFEALRIVYFLVGVSKMLTNLSLTSRGILEYGPFVLAAHNPV